jgi:hypothetical protein
MVNDAISILNRHICGQKVEHVTTTRRENLFEATPLRRLRIHLILSGQVVADAFQCGISPTHATFNPSS